MFDERNNLPSQSFALYNRYVAVPRKQLDWDFGTNMLLKINLGIVFRLTMAPNNP